MGLLVKPVGSYVIFRILLELYLLTLLEKFIVIGKLLEIIKGALGLLQS